MSLPNYDDLKKLEERIAALEKSDKLQKMAIERIVEFMENILKKEVHG